uniref:Uncharacterized protein n=1 Tax=Xiphophorus couchianus TaxID=32473 RepID=A0A3B5L614_9TELE
AGLLAGHLASTPSWGRSEVTLGRYIDVKKGSVGGLSMLLAGYCVLSYIWSYPHIKLSRWRKYH